MTDEEKQGWETYLAKQQANAHRSALKRAMMGEPDSSETRRGSVDGKGTVQIVFIPPPGVKPWVVEDEENTEQSG